MTTDNDEWGWCWFELEFLITDGLPFILWLTGACCQDFPSGDHPDLCWKPWGWRRCIRILAEPVLVFIVWVGPEFHYVLNLMRQQLDAAIQRCHLIIIGRDADHDGFHLKTPGAIWGPPEASPTQGMSGRSGQKIDAGGIESCQQALGSWLVGWFGCCCWVWWGNELTTSQSVMIWFGIHFRHVFLCEEWGKIYEFDAGCKPWMASTTFQYVQWQAGASQWCHWCLQDCLTAPEPCGEDPWCHDDNSQELLRTHCSYATLKLKKESRSAIKFIFNDDDDAKTWWWWWWWLSWW